jgi:membrane-associated phospholipid phosphatase
VSFDALIKRLDPPYGTLRYGMWRVFLVAATIGAVSATYYPLSAITMDRSVDLMTSFDRSIPFVPWTWWIYFPHYVFGLIVTTIAVRDVHLLSRVIFAILLGQVVSASFYLLLPSTYPRPLSIGEADPMTTAALTWFWGTDPANNTFPSTHVANASIAALGAWYSRQLIRWYSALVALGVFITVHTTKQHYWVDAVAGLVLAITVFPLALRLWPLPAARAGEEGSAQAPST